MKTKMTMINPSQFTVACAGAVMLMASSAMADNLFVADYSSESILEYSGGIGGTVSTFAGGLDYPTGLAFDSSGDLFESDQFSGHIYEWAGAGSTRTTFASGLNQPNIMSFSPAGNLYVSVGGNVDEFSPAGVLLNTLTGFSSAGGVVFDAAGNLYVSNIGNAGAGQGFITKITPGGVRSTFASGITYPYGMAFNAAGDMFVANCNGSGGGATYNEITEITPGGAVSTFATGLNNPGDIAFDSAGNMFVDDWGVYGGNGDITEFAANGTKSVTNLGFIPSEILFQPVPEPSVLGLIGLSAVALFGYRRRRQAMAKTLNSKSGN